MYLTHYASNTRNPRLGSREHPSRLPKDARTRSGGKGNVAAPAVSDMRPHAFFRRFLGVRGANGWRTIGGMWTDHVRSYTTPTLALGPRLRWVLAEGVDFTAKSGVI
jgi:hypothetical protein